MEAKGWIVHVGSELLSEYLLCRTKPDVYKTEVKDRHGDPTTLYATGSKWYYKYCKEGFEMLTRTSFPLGWAAPHTFIIHSDKAEELPLRESPF